MAWKFDNPLYSLTDEEQNQKARELWEGESLGGITEDNNRLPQPVVWLLALTIVTAFLITAPLWGQRPTAAIYQEYVALMDSPEVQAIDDDMKKMEFIVNKVKSQGSKYEALQDRHPLEWDDLMMIKDQIIELQNAGVDLEEYTVLGDRVILANFEGNLKPDGTKERKQPWWDKGYTIDVFYVAYFCIAVMIAVKRLPNHEWQPTHGNH
ncbi:MAG TPA: hypothetical protein ENK48_05710 [Gammaproteobacteria bacterium]|nr:hypothetical protein [Gammaproteobacteria bacterium]